MNFDPVVSFHVGDLGEIYMSLIFISSLPLADITLDFSGEEDLSEPEDTTKFILKMVRPVFQSPLYVNASENEEHEVKSNKTILYKFVKILVSYVWIQKIKSQCSPIRFFWK